MNEQEGPKGSTKKVLHFITDDAHPLDDDVAEVITKLKDVFEHRMWLWDEFPLELPKLIRPDSTSISLNDVFHRPNFDELRQVALEPNGTPISLNEEKLKEICRRGEFHVPSANFAGQSHCWRLSVLLQQGTERGTKNLHRTLALALELLIIFVHNRFVGNRFSVRKSFRAYAKAAEIFVDVVIGGRHLQIVDYSDNIKNDKEKYLMADLLITSPEQRERLENFIDYVKKGGKSNSKDFLPPLPYEYSTPTTNLNINLILHDWRIREKVFQRLGVLAHQSIDRKLFIEIRQIVFEEMKNNFSGDEENLQEIADRMLKSLLLEKYFEAVKNDHILASLSADMSKLLIENFSVREIVDGEMKSYYESMQKNCDKLKLALEIQYPIRSKIHRWMKRQIADYRENHEISNKWTMIDNVMDLARRQHLNQFAYFFDRNTYFEKEFQPTKEKEYQNIQQPSRTFRWRMMVWNPVNYIVKKHVGNKEEIVKTRFDENLLNYSDHYTDGRHKTPLNSNPTTSRYTVEKEIVRTTTTWYPFWRWTNFVHRNWAWTWNSIFYFMVYLPFGSGIGVRALFSPTVFYPEFEVNTRTGVLHPDPGSKKHSFVSRFRALWHHVHKSRARFEATSDGGFLSKGITRHYNRFWNYVVKGFCGSILLIVVNPILCIAASLFGLVVGITCPLWMPVAVAAHYLICIFIYDFDSPHKHLPGRRNVIMLVFDMVVYRIIILGIGQTVGALVTALVVLPSASLFLTVFGYIRFGIRSFWDTIMFQLVIKRYGRIPMANSFVARRISGPGLSSDYVYQITPEQAMVAVEHRIQVLELEAFSAQVKHWIDMPYNNFKMFMSSLQKHNGIDGLNCMSRNSLRNQQEDLLRQLDKLTLQRRNELKNLVTKEETWWKIRLDADSLETTLQQVAVLLQMHYPSRIFSRLCDMSVEAWWDMRNLTVDDWMGFAKLFCSELFSPQFLIPLDDKQEHFKLEVQHVNLSQYLGMLVSGEHREDLDAVLPVFESKLQKCLTLTQPSMPTSECMPFLLNETSYGSSPLYMLKGGVQHEFGLPSLKKTAQIKMIELKSENNQEDNFDS